MEEQLDKVEQAILTDIFGGYSREYMNIRYGIFKFDIGDKVQKVINDFERKIKPLMDSQGNIELESLKRYLPFINIADGVYTPMAIYESIRPVVLGVKDYLLGGIK